MSRRRQLKGAAAGVLSRFVSRNNDIGGYWGIGVIYAEFAALHAPICRLDLLTGESAPYFSQAKKVAETCRQHLFRLVEKLGLNTDQIRSASITLTFSIAESTSGLAGKKNRGERFSCQISITDDLGKEWLHHLKGHCRKHNPRQELRSLRYQI